MKQITVQAEKHLKEDVKIPNYLLRGILYNELDIKNNDILSSDTINSLFLRLYCMLYDVSTDSTDSYNILLDRLTKVSSKIKSISDNYIYVSRVKNEIDSFLSVNRTSNIKNLNIYQRSPIENALKFIEDVSILNEFVSVKNKTNYRNIFGLDFILGTEYEITYYSSINSFASCTLWYNLGANKEMNFFSTTIYSAKYGIEKIEFYKDNTVYELDPNLYTVTKYRDLIDIDFVNNEQISSIFITISIEEKIDDKNIIITGTTGYSITKDFQQISDEKIVIKSGIDYAILTSKENPIYNYLTIGTSNVYLKNINPYELPITRGFYYINKIPDIIRLAPKPKVNDDVKFIMPDGTILYPLQDSKNKIYNEYLILSEKYQEQNKLYEQTKIKIEYITDNSIAEYAIVPYLTIESLNKYDATKIGIHFDSYNDNYEVVLLSDYYAGRTLGQYTIGKEIIEIFNGKKVKSLEYPKPLLFYSEINSKGTGTDRIIVNLGEYYVPGTTHAIATYEGTEIPLITEDFVTNPGQASINSIVVVTNGLITNNITIYYEPVGKKTKREIISNIKNNHTKEISVFPSNGIFDIKLSMLSLPKIIFDEYTIDKDVFINKIHSHIRFYPFISPKTVRKIEIYSDDDIMRVYLEDSSFSNQLKISVYDMSSNGFLTTNSKDVYISHSPILIVGL